MAGLILHRRKSAPPASLPVASFEFDGSVHPVRGIPIVNGHKLLSVEHFTVEMTATETPRVTLRLMTWEALKVVLAESAVGLADETREALISLGWKPPGDE